MFVLKNLDQARCMLSSPVEIHQKDTISYELRCFQRMAPLRLSGRLEPYIAYDSIQRHAGSGSTTTPCIGFCSTTWALALVANRCVAIVISRRQHPPFFSLACYRKIQKVKEAPVAAGSKKTYHLRRCCFVRRISPSRIWMNR